MSASSIAAHARRRAGADGRDASNDVSEARPQVIGREAAVRRVAAVLSLRTKNNPALLGAPGAGKAAVVEGLAHLLANGDVPQAVRGKRLIAVDFGALVGGATRRGEVEARLRALLSEAQQAEGEGAILYLDELHSLVGPPLDAAPLLKAALKASPKLRCIGASTLEQCAASSPQARASRQPPRSNSRTLPCRYRRLVETDAALERRFQQVLLGAEQLPVEVDLPAVREAAEREVAELAAERRLLSGEQLRSLRRRADISAELEEIATQREETTAAQAAADVSTPHLLPPPPLEKRISSRSEALASVVRVEASLAATP